MKRRTTLLPWVVANPVLSQEGIFLSLKRILQEHPHILLSETQTNQVRSSRPSNPIRLPIKEIKRLTQVRRNSCGDSRRLRVANGLKPSDWTTTQIEDSVSPGHLQEMLRLPRHCLAIHHLVSRILRPHNSHQFHQLRVLAMPSRQGPVVQTTTIRIRGEQPKQLTQASWSSDGARRRGLQGDNGYVLFRCSEWYFAFATVSSNISP